MNIISVNNLNTSFYGYKNNLPNVFIGQGINYDKYQSPVDSVAFAKPRCKKKETVVDILKNAKIGRLPRFNKKEIDTLEKETRMFHSVYPTENILKRLLDMEYNISESNSKSKKLSLVDIANFFNVMSAANEDLSMRQADGIFTLMNHYLKEGYAINSTELDNVLFLPLENNPNIIKHIGKCEYQFRNLNPDDRGFIMHCALDVVENAKFQWDKYFPLIASTINEDKTSFAYRILTKGASDCRKRQFENLLNSFTPKRLAQMEKETPHLLTKEAEDKYIDNYIEQFTK